MRKSTTSPPRNTTVRKSDGATTSVAVKNIPIELILVFQDQRRPIDPDAVTRLAKSIDLEGLKTPVDLVFIKEGMTKGKYKLITGAHRLEAFKTLGKATIPAKILNATQARGLEETENIIRQAPSVLHESIAIVRRAKKLDLIEPEVQPRGGRQPHDRGASRIAKATGINRKRVAEALDHYGLPNKIRSRIQSIGLADNRRILNKLVQMRSAAEQTAFLKNLKKPTKRPKITIEAASNQDPSIERPEKISRLFDVWEKAYFKKTLELETKSIRLEFLRILASRYAKKSE
jgi:ParB-like chromosome segregation protein Spo0J